METQAEAAEADRAAMPRKPWRDRVYGRLKVSVHTMNIIIYCAVGLLVLAILLGVLTAGK